MWTAGGSGGVVAGRTMGWGWEEVDRKHSDGILGLQQPPEILGTFGTTYSAAES